MHGDVLLERSTRRQAGGSAETVERLAGQRVSAAVRRGKYLWLAFAEGRDESLLVHLGMSGQLRFQGADAISGGPAATHPADGGPVPDTESHLRARLRFDDGSELRFVDQRTFGYLLATRLVPTPDGGPGGLGSPAPVLPAEVRHIARDLLDPALEPGTAGRAALVARIRTRRTTVKRALLDQSLLSGVGNIYADEGLWRAGVHFERATEALTRREVARVLDAVAAVMRSSLEVGGTSFDALYVNVNGRSGYFDRSLAVYGQAGRPCQRCGAIIVREHFMSRSSYRCPRCQPVPRSSPRRRPVQVTGGAGRAFGTG